jgi:2-polyprenyl-3-methyl-5-hydroxy-6-metoxy-1,4-benzoquinol methylase
MGRQLRMPRVRNMNSERPVPTSEAAPESLSRELHALPSPRHLHEYLTRSQHLHLGFFEHSDELLASALDQLVLRNARTLPRNALIADIGCGLGGTTRLLAAQGHRVFGVDPCPHSIDYARKHTLSPRAQFLTADLQAFAERARGARFDAVVLFEVLASLPDLPAALSACRAVLRPGGLMLVSEIVRTRSAPESNGRHARGALRSAADACGFDLQESRDVTNRAVPTIPRLGRLLTERRTDLERVFGHTHPEIRTEIDRFQAELRTLEHGFTSQELRVEWNVLRSSARISHDSVVLRPRAGPVPARRASDRVAKG